MSECKCDHDGGVVFSPCGMHAKWRLEELSRNRDMHMQRINAGTVKYAELQDRLLKAQQLAIERGDALIVANMHINELERAQFVEK